MPRPIAENARPIPRKPKWRSKGWWLRQLHSWHYMSAAVSLAGMLMFAITGVTLNHSASIGAKPVTVDREGRLPASLLRQIARETAPGAPLSPAVAAAARSATGLDPAGHSVEWSETDAYVALPRPGGDAWINIERATGRITSERTSRGWISYLNDLHKGRNAGASWGWLIDIFAAACIVFSVTGLFLLKFLARNRPLTWPLVGLGVGGPMLVALILIH